MSHGEADAARGAACNALALHPAYLVAVEFEIRQVQCNRRRRVVHSLTAERGNVRQNKPPSSYHSNVFSLQPLLLVVEIAIAPILEVVEVVDLVLLEVVLPVPL